MQENVGGRGALPANRAVDHPVGALRREEARPRSSPARLPLDDDEAEIETRDYVVEVAGKRFEVVVHGEAIAAAPAANGAAARQAPKRGERKSGGGGGGGDTLASPLQGNVWKVLVEEGADVEEGALICIIEAMKMENEITANKAGKIAELPISEGGSVTAGDTIAVIKSPSE